MKFKPMPGIVIIDPISANATASIIIDGNKEAKIKKGKIIAVGDNLIGNNHVLEMNNYCKKGEIVFFLTYDGSYDIMEINNKTYHAVKIEDLRTRYYE